jgi:hypothetical protein
MALADELGEVTRTHPVGQGAGGRGYEAVSPFIGDLVWRIHEVILDMAHKSASFSAIGLSDSIERRTVPGLFPQSRAASPWFVNLAASQPHLDDRFGGPDLIQVAGNDGATLGARSGLMGLEFSLNS